MTYCTYEKTTCGFELKIIHIFSISPFLKRLWRCINVSEPIHCALPCLCLTWVVQAYQSNSPYGAI